MQSTRYRHTFHSVLFALGLAMVQPASAAESKAFNIPAQSLDRAITELARQSGLAIGGDAALLRGRQAPALQGNYTPDQALQLLLSGTDITWSFNADGSVALARLSAASGTIQLNPLRVQGQSSSANVLPPAYTGGQVARGARIGMLGNIDIMDAPVSVVAFTSEFRDNTQALSVSDMLKYSVSAQTPQAGAVPTTDVIYVRGFNIGTYEGTFEGLPGLLGRMPPVEGVERVELFLGANAFTNGQPGSVGGNINIVPKRAEDEPLLRIGGNYRTESILGTTMDAGRRFGAGNAFGLRVNTSWSNGDTELDNGERKTFSRALAFDYRGERTRLTFDYMGNDRRLPSEAWFVINSGVAVPDAEKAARDFRQPWSFYKDQWDAVIGRGEWDLTANWTLSAAAGRMWNKVERLSQVSEIFNDAGDMQDAWGGTLGHSKQRRKVDSSELMLSGSFDTSPLLHSVRLGLGNWGEESGYNGIYSDVFYPFLSNIYNNVDYLLPALGEPTMPSDYTSRSSNRSLFLSDNISLLDDRLHLMLGARRLQYETEYLDTSTGVWGGDPSKSKWSPAVGVLYKLQPNISLYLNRLEAMDAGYQVQPPATNAGEILPPLPADQNEAGVKVELGGLGMTAAVFEIDKPSYFYDAVTGIEGANGRQLNRGVELSLFGEIASGLRLYSSATWIDPKMEKTWGGSFDGKLAVSAARFITNVYADWDVPGITGLALQGGMSHTGAVYNDEINTQKLNAWTRIDAGLRYRTQALGKPATLRLTVDNLMDDQYWVTERGTIYLAPMRTIGLSFTIDL